MIERCNNTSVGILVEQAGRLLLIERRKPPYGWAPPAGHVEELETYQRAAGRELAEEVGLNATRLRRVHSRRYDNQCRRPGGSWHLWEVYAADVTGSAKRSEDETSAMRWVTRCELADLVAVTRKHLANDAGPKEWQRAPGLEPVWLDMLSQLGWVK